MNFLELFEEILIDEQYVLKGRDGNHSYVEFPLDLLIPRESKDGRTAYSLPKAGKTPERHIESDYILVPFLDEVQTEVDAAKLVAAAALDRSMVVHDATSSSGCFSLRLIQLMKQIMKRNSGSALYGRLTDLFISDKIYPTEGDTIYGVKIHPVKNEFWDEISSFYKQLGGTYPDNTQNLVIGAGDRRADYFVRPIRKINGHEGLAILSNKEVLLGCV